MGRRKRTGGPAFSLFAFQDIVTCVMGIMLLLTLMMSLQIQSTPETQLQSKVKGRAALLAQEASRLLSEIDRMEADLAVQGNALTSGAVLDPVLLERTRDRVRQDSASAEAESQRVQMLVQTSSAALSDVRSRHGEIAQIQAESELLASEVLKGRQELQDLKSGHRRVYNAHESSSKSCWLVEISSPTDIRLAVMGDEENASVLEDIPSLMDRISTLGKQDVAVMLLVKPDAASDLGPLSTSLIENKIPFGFDLLPQDVVVLGSTMEQAP